MANPCHPVVLRHRDQCAYTTLPAAATAAVAEAVAAAAAAANLLLDLRVMTVVRWCVKRAVDCGEMGRLIAPRLIPREHHLEHHLSLIHLLPLPRPSSSLGVAFGRDGAYKSVATLIHMSGAHVRQQMFSFSNSAPILIGGSTVAGGRSNSSSDTYLHRVRHRPIVLWQWDGLRLVGRLEMTEKRASAARFCHFR